MFSRDPNETKRTATSISWYPDGAKKLAIAYSMLEFQKLTSDTCMDSYIWEIGETDKRVFIKASVSTVSI